MEIPRIPKAIMLLIVGFCLGAALTIAGLLIMEIGHPRLGNGISLPGQIVLLVAVVGLIAAAISRAVPGVGNDYGWAVIFGGGVAVISFLVPAFLVFLATNGNASAFWAIFDWFAGNGGTVAQVEGVLPLVVTLLLVGIPSILHSRRKWRESGSPKKEVVLGWVVLAASLVTGLFGIMIHFVGRGPAQGIPLGQFSVAVLLAVLLLVPRYRSLASAFSSSGLMEACNPASFWANQKEALDVLRRAFSIQEDPSPTSERAENIAASDDSSD